MSLRRRAGLMSLPALEVPASTLPDDDKKLMVMDLKEWFANRQKRRR